MCFKDHDDFRIIHSSIHKYKSGRRYFNICNNKYASLILKMEIETKGGLLSIKINKNNKEEINYENVQTQELLFTLSKGESYKIEFVSKHHVGKWKVAYKEAK